MPRKRRHQKRRLDVLTLDQKSHLGCGVAFFGHDCPFEDEEHRRDAWALHREALLAEWDLPGRRPEALWKYDYGLRPQPWPKGWSWPRPIQTEAEMVHAMLKAGELEPCRFNGVVPIENELAVIEANWLHEISFTIGSHVTLPTLDRPLTTYGTPVWFYRERAPAIFAQQRREAAAWRARIRLDG